MKQENRKDGRALNGGQYKMVWGFFFFSRATPSQWFTVNIFLRIIDER